MNNVITFEELRELGCPDGLLMQYLGWTRLKICELLEKTNRSYKIILNET